MIAHRDEVERARVDWKPAAAARWTDLGRATGASGVGSRLVDVDAGRLSVNGVLELWPTPAARRLHGEVEFEARPVRAGHVVSRPPEPGSPIRSAPATAARPSSPTATGSQSDVCHYPRSNKIFWRGVGLIARLEPLDCDDGEPEE